MDLRLLVSLLVGAGFVLAVVSLVLAYRDAKRQVRVAGERIELTKQLSEQEKAEHANRTADQQGAEFGAAITSKYEALHEQHGIIRATWANSSILPAIHAQRVLSTIVNSSKANLIWAGVGLLISTGASIWGLWLA